MIEGPILISGGAGYIGSHTLKILLSQGHEIIVVDNLSTGHRWAVPSNVKFYQIDLLDKPALKNVFKENNIKHVIHFAAKTSVEESVKNPDLYFENNYQGSLNLIESCKENKIGNFVFSSTAAIYGNTKKNPISEDTEPAPINPYGKSKLMTEEALSSSGMNTITFRYFNVAGAMLDGSLGQATKDATHLIKIAAEVACGKRDFIKIFGTDYPTSDGTCIRDYIHVEDIAEAHILGLKYLIQSKKSVTLNLGYGHGYSVRQVIDVMRKASGHKIPTVEVDRRSGDTIEVVADSNQAKLLLQWKPKYDNLELICSTAFKWESKFNN